MIKFFRGVGGLNKTKGITIFIGLCQRSDVYLLTTDPSMGISELKSHNPDDSYSFEINHFLLKGVVALNVSLLACLPIAYVTLKPLL